MLLLQQISPSDRDVSHSSLGTPSHSQISRPRNVNRRSPLKDTNPKDAVGTKKVPLSTIPCGPVLLAGLAMLEGARKYGRHNYRAIGVRASVYYDAVVGRHIMPWWEGQDIDPDSGLNHIDKAIAGLLVLRDSMLSGNWIDDRPIRNPIDLCGLNAQAADIVERYPDAPAPFVERTTQDAVPATKPPHGTCDTCVGCEFYVPGNHCESYSPGIEP